MIGSPNSAVSSSSKSEDSSSRYNIITDKSAMHTSLEIFPVDSDDQKYYVCKFKTSSGEAQHVFKLTVQSETWNRFSIFCFGSWIGSFLLTPPPPTMMDIQIYKRRNVLTHARVNFRHSETSLLLHGGSYILSSYCGGGRGEGVNRKDPLDFSC